MLCVGCGSLFETARRVVERHGLDSPPYEEYLACPCCGGTDLRSTNRCDVCGHWITGEYILTVDGNRICNDCYVEHDIEDD